VDDSEFPSQMTATAIMGLHCCGKDTHLATDHTVEATTVRCEQHSNVVEMAFV
jgi:hypothetical protein